MIPGVVHSSTHVNSAMQALHRVRSQAIHGRGGEDHHHRWRPGVLSASYEVGIPQLSAHAAHS